MIMMTFTDRMSTGATGVKLLLLALTHCAIALTWFERAFSPLGLIAGEGYVFGALYLLTLLALGLFVLYHWAEHCVAQHLHGHTPAMEHRPSGHAPWWWRFLFRKRGKFKGWMRNSKKTR
jgi:hypothetical protein